METKIVIIADIHGNYDALSALPEDYDELWVLGDLVNYGPQPQEVVADIMAHASAVIRGNHDHAIAHDSDPHWKPRYSRMAETTRNYTASVLSDQQKEFLRNLPLGATLERRGTTFYLTHATPSDPLHGSHLPDSEEWVSEVECVSADVLLVGHTHVPFLRRIGEKVLLNPGSLGQSRSGRSVATYAVWEDGVFALKAFQYRREETIKKLRALSFPPDVEKDVVSILNTGVVSN